jgi:High potential iron-sulfur protein
MRCSRRSFVTTGAVVAAAASLTDAARAQGVPRLSESDPTAAGLGYKADATAVDRSKFPQYAPGQRCSTCALYQAKPDASEGPCTIFSGKLVYAKGWCAAYAKRS